MLEVIRFSTPSKKIIHKYYKVSLDYYLKVFNRKFNDLYKQVAGFLPQQPLNEFVVVRVKRRLSLDEEVKNVNIDLFSIKKPDDVLIAVGVDPKDSSIKKVVIEQFNKTNIEGNVVYNYKRMIFKWGIVKLKLDSVFEVDGSFTKYYLKRPADLKKEHLVYLFKRMYEKRTNTTISMRDIINNLSGKTVLKVEFVIRQRTETYTDVGRRVNRQVIKVEELIVEV